MRADKVEAVWEIAARGRSDSSARAAESGMPVWPQPWPTQPQLRR
jgi:hypothetical protein